LIIALQTVAKTRTVRPTLTGEGRTLKDTRLSHDSRGRPSINGFVISKIYGAGDEVQTRDIQLGRLTLYQLSYSRKSNMVAGGRHNTHSSVIAFARDPS
jgi:hypothetical protein